MPETLRAGETLTVKEQTIHDDGLVTTLGLLHDELDALVQAAYGWTGVLSDQQVLTQLTALNAARHQQERQGTVLYLRPEYQDPKGTAMRDLDMGAGTLAVRVAAVPSFPAKLMDRAVAVQHALQTAPQPLTSAQVTALFKGARAASVEEVLDTLVFLGHAKQFGSETQTLRYGI
ncbi:hypothetical protein [Deinococcus frigens]|uniref:hypothetical protein n=1 Tax=Deinococcus frigens TaxID=249403 RepID=UPI000AAA411A|nr:hypothetical protein [Deinococcus frigens]